MKRLDAHIGAAKCPLEQRPEILDAVGGNLTVNILLSMIDNVVDVFAVKVIVRAQRVRVHGRSALDMLAHVTVKWNPARAIGIKTLPVPKPNSNVSPAAVGHRLPFVQERTISDS
jgi:hypothetical protein